MADLSAYINFSAQFSIADSKIVLTDTSTYPGGVAPGIIGIFSIKQPDTVTRTGNWNAPDVSWDGSALTVYLETLRASATDLYQQGDFTITYQVDHPSYVPTTLTRTFTFTYTRQKLSLQESFDCFTPVLKYLDNTNYSITGYNTASSSNAWSAVFNAAGVSTTITASNTNIFDLIYSGSYWDSLYAIGFSKTIVYQNTSLSWLSIADVLTKSINTAADTPPSLTTLLGYIDDLKTVLDAEANCNSSCSNDTKCKYIYAISLFSHIRNRICVLDLTGMTAYVTELVQVTHNYITPPYVNTNAILPAYNFIFCTGGGGATASVIILEVIIGSAAADSLGWHAGDTVLTNANFALHLCEVFRGGLPLPGIDPMDGGQFFTKVEADTFLTLSVALATGDLIKIKVFT